ncbi:MAG: HlyC/CorC family transporter [Epulopiscium sp.]|nr:HlyC/CorC family transporter [Candidatus Epulonipiscium sp.]
MDSDSTLLIITLVFLILMSAYFSAAETAFSAINRIRLKNLANNGNKKAKAALNLSQNYDELLSTILIGNNIVNIAAASIGTVVFSRYFGSAGVAISTVVMTVIILIFSEISPKSLAKEAPEKFAMWATPGLKILVFIFTPVNYLFMSWKKLLSKTFKVKDDRSITEEELLTIIDEAQNEGGINEQEGELIRSAIEFNDLDVNDVLTPRVNVVAIDLDYSDEEINKLFIESGFSRMPVYESSIDNIIGVIHEKNFHSYLQEDKEKVYLRDIIKPVIWATDTTKISKLLKLLQTTKSHMAIITDEYGGTAGIVTLEDILEELVGEIWDEHDEIIEEFVKIKDNEYKISASASIDKMFDLFNINREYESNTVAGFVIGELGKFPNENDSFNYENLKITVTKTDFRRILEIHVAVIGDNKSDI